MTGLRGRIKVQMIKAKGFFGLLKLVIDEWMNEFYHKKSGGRNFQKTVIKVLLCCHLALLG